MNDLEIEFIKKMTLTKLSNDPISARSLVMQEYYAEVGHESNNTCQYCQYYVGIGNCSTFDNMGVALNSHCPCFWRK